MLDNRINRDLTSQKKPRFFTFKIDEKQLQKTYIEQPIANRRRVYLNDIIWTVCTR